MPNAKDKQKQKSLRDWLGYLSEEDVLRRIMQLTPSDIAETGPTVAALCKKAAEIWPEEPVDLAQLSVHLNRAWQANGCPETLKKALEHYRVCQKGSRVGHKEKRTIAHWLGLLNRPYSVSELLASDTELDLPFILRRKERSHECPVRRWTTLSEVIDGNAFVANEDTGFEVIDVETSIIIYSVDNNGNIVVELVVLRGVGCDTPFTQELFNWIYAVIVTACAQRRDVRTGDVGEMIQLGLNMGARTARALGHAASFTTTMSHATKIERDRDAVGVISLAWGLMEKLMPKEVIDATDKQLRDLKLPELATRNLAPGPGYTVQIGDTPVTFPTAKRAPPEGYLWKGYEARAHIDQTYSPYAFTLNVDRRLNQKKIPQQSGPSPHITRGQSKRLAQEPAPLVLGPPGGGASFVDITLRVVVRQAPGTMMVIRPDYMHGTSMGYGMENSGITITFSERIVEPWLAATRGERGISVESSSLVDNEH